VRKQRKWRRGFRSGTRQARLRQETSDAAHQAAGKLGIRIWKREFVPPNLREETGTYRVQASDLPVSLVYLCGPENQQVCSRELHEGEVIGNVAGTP